MTRIRHIAIRTPDVEKTAAFYMDVFGLTEAGKANSGVYLTDGHINVAILRTLDAGDRPGFSGIDHFGFQVDDIDETCKKLQEQGSEELASRQPTNERSYYEIKYRGPDRQVIDVTHSGWLGGGGDRRKFEPRKGP